MPRLRHELPTHLNVEDRAIWGLSVRQLSYLVGGVSAAYGLWTDPSALPDEARAVLALLCLLAAVAFALVRPRGRALEEWAGAALHHALGPRRALWRVPEPDPADWRPPASTWAALEPRPTWTGGGA
jgi:hypothetical protein